MRIYKLWPHTDWTQVWKNFNDVHITENMRCVWYQVIHDILPTNARLHRVNVTQSNTCLRCVSTDTLEHLLTACGEGQLIWNHAKSLLARMLRTSPAHIPEDWLLRPHFHIWPPKWTLANVIIFRLQQLTTPALKDFMDFLLDQDGS